jgi:glycosyltransferase involved in cell wall biosynthesis
VSSRLASESRTPDPGPLTPVSVLITARDEEEQLPGALASVASWAGEVVVVFDPRSADRTGELARASRARVLEHEYASSGAQCNWGLDRCEQRWVFVLDADERVTPPLAAAVREAVREPHHDAYAVRRANHAFGRRLRFGDWGRDRVVRLVDRERARFSELSVHGAVQAASVGRLAGDLHHDTLRSLGQYLPKVHDYAQRGAADLVAAGRRATVVKAIAHAEWRFARGLVLRLGVLDGPAGWAVAILMAYGTYLKWLAAWDLQRHSRFSSGVGMGLTSDHGPLTTPSLRATGHGPWATGSTSAGTSGLEP